MAMPEPIETPPRLVLVDALRGLAIAAMVIYHFAWDLSYYELIEVDVTTHPAWVVLQRSILSSFLALVGVSLVLAHGKHVRWNAFWRRLAILVAAALAVTLGTYWMFPDYFVFFGILHAIALFSVMALPFLGLSPWLVLLSAAAFLVLPALFSAPEFTSRPLAWIGFWPSPPETTDIVPVFPWFGVVLLGLFGARLLLASPAATWLYHRQARSPFARGLVLLGRWSLLVYLVHQPILLGAISLVTQMQSPVLQPEVLSRAESFAASCRSTCAAGGQAAPYCRAYCACALEQVENEDLWNVIEGPEGNPKKAAAIASIGKLCTAMAD